jgi:pectate lyase
MFIRITHIFFSLVILSSCSAQKQLGKSEEAIAFPGAEGFGKHTTGGRGGKVYIVSNLKDDGEGSFRKAATAKEPRIIVFAVSGTIHLLSPLSIRTNATIAGQTAPGGGICIADQPVSLGGNNIIIRFLRFRMGDRYQNKGMVHGAGHDDALNSYRRSNIIIDHCSISWSTDECFSVYNGDSTTLQWNLISEPLNYSYHFETGDKDFENHGYGGIWGGRHLSAHHNLFAHCVSRTPRFDGIRNINEEFVDYRNNVIYNWGGNNVYGGEGGRYNVLNNYYKPGKTTSKSSKSRILSPNKEEKKGIGYGKFFVDGNYVDGYPGVSSDNYKGIHMGNNGTEEDKRQAIVSSAFAAPVINTETAVDAYQSVLKHAGAILPLRDTLDQRIVNDVKNGSGNIIDVQGGYPHGTNYELTVNAWPKLESAASPKDTDQDGMPDDWELKNKLHPGNGSDNSGNDLHPVFTNIEVYINSLVIIN